MFACCRRFPVARRPSAELVNACELYYAVVHGALGERQAARGAQPTGTGTQGGGRGHHGVPPVQPSAVDRVHQRARRRTAACAAARRVRRPARAARPAKHGQRGQRQQHRVQRRPASGHPR